jgi:ubiquinone/menaquinone biosynthesis C-methylase UbiE
MLGQDNAVMAAHSEFAPVCRRLRDEIIEHYWQRGEAIDDDAGRRTLDTNTTLVPQRAELLLELVARRSGRDSLEGLDVADLGCGFGAISLYFASAGARVVGLDPNHERLQVGASVARELGLPATLRRGWFEALPLPDESFDLVVLNNSLCYVTEDSDRRWALANALRILRPGGWMAMRNPSLGSPLDPFTGLPFVHQLPGAVAAPFLRLTARGRTRSKVKLISSMSARREVRRAGFAEVRIERGAHERRPSRYQHLTARRPEGPGRSSASA